MYHDGLVGAAAQITKSVEFQGKWFQVELRRNFFYFRETVKFCATSQNFVHEHVNFREKLRKSQKKCWF
jgi:hypothetical protein